MNLRTLVLKVKGESILWVGSGVMNHLNIFYSTERYLFSILTDELHLIPRGISLTPY